MKLVSLLLHVAIASAAAAAFSFLLSVPALGLFCFAAAVFLGLIAANDYAPRAPLVTSLPATHSPASSARRASPLRLAA